MRRNLLPKNKAQVAGALFLVLLSKCAVTAGVVLPALLGPLPQLITARARRNVVHKAQEQDGETPINTSECCH